jgi:hypothetical protein
VYGEVPLLKERVVVRVELWAVSMIPGLTPMAGAARTGLTVTATDEELTVSGVPELSVT